MMRITSNPQDIDVEILKERLVRNLVFGKQFDHKMISKNNMMLYKHIFKFEDAFNKTIGPSKMDFDRRFMCKPPEKSILAKS